MKVVANSESQSQSQKFRENFEIIKNFTDASSSSSSNQQHDQLFRLQRNKPRENHNIVWDDSEYADPTDLIEISSSFSGSSSSSNIRLAPSTIYDQITPGLIVLLVVLCECLLLLNLTYIILFRKYRQSPSYHILTHYMCAKFLFCFTEFFNILSSGAFEKTSFYLTPTSWVCFLGRFSTFFFETVMNFQLILMWLCLLAERRMVGCRWLVADFQLRKYNKRTENSTIAETTTTTTTTTESPEDEEHNSYLRRLKTRSLRSFLVLNSRTFALVAFYMGLALLTVVPFSTIEVRSFSRMKRCSIYRFFDTAIVLVAIGLVFLFFLPTFYWVCALSTIFGKMFGGVRDPVRRSLTDSDLIHIRFVKAASVLKFVENFFLHVVATHDFMITKKFYEITRLSGLAVMLIVAVLFVVFENVFVKMRQSLTSSSPESSSQGGDSTANRISTFVFRNRHTDDEAIVYRNLVEEA